MICPVSNIWFLGMYSKAKVVGMKLIFDLSPFRRTLARNEPVTTVSQPWTPVAPTGSMGLFFLLPLSVSNKSQKGLFTLTVSFHRFLFKSVIANKSLKIYTGELIQLMNTCSDFKFYHCKGTFFPHLFLLFIYTLFFLHLFPLLISVCMAHQAPHEMSIPLVPFSNALQQPRRCGRAECTVRGT